MPCAMITQNQVTSQVSEITGASASALLRLLVSSPHSGGQAEQETVPGQVGESGSCQPLAFPWKCQLSLRGQGCQVRGEVSGRCYSPPSGRPA